MSQTDPLGTYRVQSHNPFWSGLRAAPARACLNSTMCLMAWSHPPGWVFPGISSQKGTQESPDLPREALWGTHLVIWMGWSTQKRSMLNRSGCPLSKWSIPGLVYTGGGGSGSSLLYFSSHFWSTLEVGMWSWPQWLSSKSRVIPDSGINSLYREACKAQGEEQKA